MSVTQPRTLVNFTCHHCARALTWRGLCRAFSDSSSVPALIDSNPPRRVAIFADVRPTCGADGSQGSSRLSAAVIASKGNTTNVSSSEGCIRCY